MKRFLKSFLAIIAALALLFCGGCQKDDAKPDDTQEYGYARSGLYSDAEVLDICLYDDITYMLTYSDETFALLAQEDGQVAELSSTSETDICWSWVAAGKDGVYMVESCFVEDGDGYSEEYSMIWLDSSGGFKSRFELSKEPVYDICVDDAGKTYLQYANSVLVLDNNGQEAGELLPAGEFVDRVVTGGDGSVFVLSIMNNSISALGYSVEGLSVEKEYQFDSDDKCFGGYGRYDLLIATDDGLYGAADGGTEMLFQWSENGIVFNMLQELCCKSTGELVCLDSGKTYSLSQIPVSEMVPRITITLGVFGDSNLRSMVQMYNAESEKYYVEIRDYLDGGGSFEDGVEQLNLDFVSSTAPDMIDLAGTDFDQYGEKGLLEDIGQLIADDSEISIEDYFLLDAMEKKGSLFAVAPSFMLFTYAGLESVFPDGQGCTFDEIKQLLDSNQADSLVDGMSSSVILDNSITCGYDSLIDWGRGECCFSGDEFVQMLQMAKQMGCEAQSSEMTDVEKLEERCQLLMPLTLLSLYEAATLNEQAGQQLAFVGWPTADGDNGTVAYLADPVAINAQSGNKDGAWDFVKYILCSDEVQSTVSAFPIKKSVFDDLARELMDHSDMGSVEGTYTRLLELISNIDTFYQYNSTVGSIIQEEAAAYFAGDKTPEETAEIIQNRMQTYIAEQG